MRKGNRRSKGSEENARVTSHVRLEASRDESGPPALWAQDERSIKDWRPDAEDSLFVKASQACSKVSSPSLAPN